MPKTFDTRPAGGFKARPKGVPVTNVANEKPADVPDSLTDGESIVVTKGDVPQDRDDFVVAGERSAVGLRGKVDGDAYVAVGGPNKGSVVQPIREEGTGNLLAVPVERLARPTGSRGGSRARVGYSRKYAEAYDRIFKKG